VFCAHCQGIHIEDLELFDPYLRMTNRLALYVYELCQFMTVSEVARHLGLNWKTVKGIDKFYLQRDYGQLDYQGLRLLAVDEISIRKGQRYLTVVLDYLSGRVIFVGKERKAKTLERFFNKLTVKQRKAIEAIVMDMWDPYIKAVKKNCLRLKSSSIFSTSWPILTSLSIRSESTNIVRPPNRTRLSIKVQGTCCLKTAKTCDA
jgi:transposase